MDYYFNYTWQHISKILMYSGFRSMFIIRDAQFHGAAKTKTTAQVQERVT